MAGSEAGAGFPLGARIAGYRLEAVIGRGGMAVVYRGLDEMLNRQVAVKILAPALAADEEFRQRFIRESQSAAMVDDPHIIPIFAAGEADGVLYIAMRYVPSGDVGSLVRREGPLPPARATAVISAAASALDAAHVAGLVHRDVKPANMLADLRHGRPDHVYLSDFGLAKTAAATLTGTDHFLGTLDYCAPEQIQGQAVDGRADQYALACSAFMILAGVPPFTRQDGLAVLHAHLAAPPARLSDRMPGVPAAVDGVLERALAKAPGDRYRTCGEFAAELRAAFGLAAPGEVYQGGGHPPTEAAVPGGAHAAAPALPASAAYRAPAAASAARRSRRTPGLAVAAVAGVAVLAAGGGVAAAVMTSGNGGQSPPALAGPSRAASTKAVETGGQATGQAATPPASSPAAHGTAGPGSPPVTSPPVTSPPVTSPPAPGPAPVNPGTVSAALVRSLPDPGSAPRHVNSVAFSRNGAMLVTGDSNGEASVWSVPAGRLLSVLRPGAGGKIFAVAISANGALAATGAGNGRTYLWSTGTGRLVGSVTDPGGKDVDSVAFSPDGTTLATGDGNGGIYLWNVSPDGSSAALSRTLSDPLGAGVWALAFSPDGTALAAGDYQDTTCLWELGSSAFPTLLTGPGGQQDATAVAFSPDGSTLATGYADGEVYLWNRASRTRTVISEPATVWGVAYGKGGLLAIGDDDGSTYLVDPASGQARGTLTDPASGSQGVGAVAFSPDGRTLAAGDTNGTTYLWHVGG